MRQRDRSKLLRVCALVVLASVWLAGCARHSSAVAVAPPPGPKVPDATARRGPGAAMLAAVHEAREALALRDPIAAYNDISQALDAGRQMGDQGTVEQGTQSLTALLESFPVQAKLLSAQALLTAGKAAAADALLVGIENRIPDRLMPRNLVLLEAAASLELARQAASLGTPQLRTQLLCAVSALRAYRGSGYAQETMALAAALDRALADPAKLRTLLPEQVSIWLATVKQLAGTDRWA